VRIPKSKEKKALDYTSPWFVRSVAMEGVEVHIYTHRGRGGKKKLRPLVVFSSPLCGIYLVSK
jgi:hypothetical protein